MGFQTTFVSRRAFRRRVPKGACEERDDEKGRDVWYLSRCELLSSDALGLARARFRNTWVEDMLNG
jgi:hypothetical protein